MPGDLPDAPLVQRKSANPSEAPAERRREIEALYQRFSTAGRRRLRWRRLFWGVCWAIWLQLLNGLKRVSDFAVAALLLVILFPLILAGYALARASGGGVARSIRLGRWAREFTRYSYRFGEGPAARIAGRAGLGKLPVLFNVLKGDLAFIGPRPIAPEEASRRELLAWRRYNVRPGLICLWWIRQRANIAYATETEIDLEYLETQSLWGDLGIALRAVPAVLYGSGVATAPETLGVLGIRLNNLTMSEALDFVMDRVARRYLPPAQICFINADCANLAWDDTEYDGVLAQADLALADGIGLKMAGKLLARDIRQNVNGTDLFPRLCERLAAAGGSLYLLGARPGIAELVALWVARNYPGTAVKGVRNGYFSEAEQPAVIGDIAASGADVLLVAFGAPRQEKWIRRHLAETGVRVALGVGGLFDFYSGRIPRAPQWMREMGLEWLYRFLQEPGRMWKRYFHGNVIFLFRVIQERLGHLPRRNGTESYREV